jgi:endonuclease/exonuclease/phosphatase (EEP) superfamily protein YafD
LIQEATPHLVHQLEPLRKMYPYIVEAPEYGPFGMILFSQIPISNAVRIPFKCGDKHYTVMDFTSLKQQIPFTLIEAHTSSPERDDQMLQRNQELDELSNFISNLTTENKILIGDLNTTPYSPYFSNLLKNSGLINAMQGLRILGTWPDFLPFFLRIPIDHLLVSKNIQVLKQEVCPPVGSDHLPVLTSIKIAQ